MNMELNKEAFRTKLRGKETLLHQLRNGKGLEVAVTNYGARFVSIIYSGKNGKPVDVVVGFDSIDGYLRSTETYYSALVGRYANRIAHGRFELDGQSYQLAINNAPNHLHGGPNGFHHQVWDVLEADEQHIRLSYLSPDGEEGYPGNLRVTVVYRLDENGDLSIQYEAFTDAPTVLNLTSHPFFNLNGQGSGSIENHLLQIHAEQYMPVNEALIPRGIEPVAGTAFDFRSPRRIGERIHEDQEQLRFGAGYDHNYVLDGSGFRTVAIATGDQSGIVMEVRTDQPGMQLYSGNYMKGENAVKYGMKDLRREAFCLETQHHPDSPNHPQFPSTVLRPGDHFRSETVYAFRTTA